MARHQIGQEALGLPGAGQPSLRSTLDQLVTLIDWAPVEARLRDVYAAAKGSLISASAVQGVAYLARRALEDLFTGQYRL